MVSSISLTLAPGPAGAGEEGAPTHAAGHRAAPVALEHRYDADALLDVTPADRYWRRGGFSTPGRIAQVAGMVASLLCIDAAAFVGPLSGATGGSDFSVFTGLIVGGGVYWLLAGRSVRAEVLEAPTSSRRGTLAMAG